VLLILARGGAVKGLSTVSSLVSLTLVTCLVFYYSSVTHNDLLEPSETTFVFGF
jgi:hypothetical protein